MGAKIKKEPKKTAIISKDEDIKSKLTTAVPCMGVILMAAMGTYASSPVVAQNSTAVTAFWVIGAIGVAYAFCTYMWRLTAGPKGITVRALPRGERMIPYEYIKRVEVTKISGEIAWFTVIAKNERKFLRMYRVMTNCVELLERLKKLGIKVVEK
ncbi:MAG: hypothetical protein IJ374_02810 [Lachnospiraceae bacterium]|nr:hypothetical protein [Lachnospiraceae bacterium]